LNERQQSSLAGDRRAEFFALAGELRPQLHRYCARLMGSVIDGEDVVQDTLARALAALGEIEEMPQIRPWLFRIAHNRALDLLAAGQCEWPSRSKPRPMSPTKPTPTRWRS
jgi:RNA polymerase sigma-70 factor, ECF subfamily